MYLISTEGYEKFNVHHLIVQKAGEIWASMKNAGSGMGVKNMSDLVSREIHGVLKTKNPTKEQINEYTMTEREIYEMCANMELSTKRQKCCYDYQYKTL